MAQLIITIIDHIAKSVGTSFWPVVFEFSGKNFFRREEGFAAIY